MSDENKTQGAWVITDVFSKHGIRITVKSSGENTASAIDDLYQGISHGIDTYGWALEQQGAPKPTQPATQNVILTPAPSIVGKLHDTDPQISTLEVVKVNITPSADGKIKVGFFSPGHQWADLTTNMGLDATLKMLATTGYDWSADQLKAVADFPINCYADWRNSDKMNKNGVPYKNLIALRAIDATA